MTTVTLSNRPNQWAEPGPRPVIWSPLLGSSTSSRCSVGCFFAARISCLTNAPTAIKNAAATKSGGVKAARSLSTLVASISKALRSLGDEVSTRCSPSRFPGLVPGQSACSDSLSATGNPQATARRPVLTRSRGTPGRVQTGGLLLASVRQLTPSMAAGQPDFHAATQTPNASMARRLTP